MITIFNSEKWLALRNKETKGFTLIELLVVVGILGVLLGVIIAVFDPVGQLQKSRDAQRKSDLGQIQRALEQFYDDNNGKYPSSDGTYRILALDNTVVAWGASFSPFMNILPKDPSGGRNYVYYSPALANGQTYFLYASLERGIKDLQACSGGLCSGAGIGGLDTACGGTCNYGVSSSNVSP